MASNEIAGVMRAGAYSPNHIGNDSAIFNATADQLRKRGYVVNVYSEEQFRKTPPTEDVIINMCREEESLLLLQKMEDEGRLVVNSGYGIENCTRERMTRLLAGAGVPQPYSLMVNTNEAIIDELHEAEIENCWIKRGDRHAMHKEDVSYCRHAVEAQEILQEFFYRGIRRAVINKHLNGDLVKFYGIAGSDYFYCFRPFEAHYSKYGNEDINGKSHDYLFKPEILHDYCKRAADATGIKIYGGDAIISEEGDISIIDWNDWPSFAPCRADAAPHIAKAIIGYIKAYRNGKGR